MVKKAKKDELKRAAEDFATMMLHSLEQFSPEEQERRLKAIRQITAKIGRGQLRC